MSLTSFCWTKTCLLFVSKSLHLTEHKYCPISCLINFADKQKKHSYFFSYIPQRYENQAQTDHDFEAMLAEDEAKIIPGFGDDGIAVSLEGEEKELGEKLMAKEAFNIVLSNKISLTRTVPDARHPM